MTPSLGFWSRLVLRLLPAHVRDEHERELRQFLELDRSGRGDRGESFRAWLALAADVLRAAPRAHRDVLRQDLVAAGRQLRRSPGFAIAAVTMLGLGLASTTSVFLLVDGVLLRPLSLRDPNRLVEVTEEHPERGFRRFGISPANLVDLTADSSLFLASTGYQRQAGTVRVGDTPIRMEMAGVAAGFFRVFTDPPLAGRTLGSDDDAPGSRVVVVSHRFWRGALGGDPEAVGRLLEIDGAGYRVVGVMGPKFTFPDPEVGLWLPLGLGADELGTRGARFLTGVARLGPRATRTETAAAVAVKAAALAAAHPATNRGWTAAVLDLREAMVESVRAPLRLAFAAAAMVLLIALANVANLLLGRAVAREGEIAVRAALGARPGRLLRQLATEGLVLVGLGTILGIGLTALGLGPLRAFAASAIPRIEDVRFDYRAAGFAAMLAAAITLALTTVPAAQARRLALWRVLGATRAGQGRIQARWQTALAVAEVSLAVVVMISAGLVLRTVTRLFDRPLGFAPHGAVVFRIEPPWRAALEGPIDSVVARLGRDRARVDRQLEELFHRLAGLPGATAVGAVNRLPLTGNYWITSIDRADRPAPTRDRRIPAHVRPATPGYFEALGTPVRRGRGILPADRADSEPVVVIDEILAEKAFGAENPLGREVLLDGPPGRPWIRARVVGVAAPVLMAGLDGAARPTFYVPFAQAGEGHSLNWGMDVVVRGPSVADVAAAVPELARAIIPDAPVFGIRGLETLAAASIADRRLHLTLLGGFAAVALLLATLGLGGLLFLIVERRRRELAIRMALGAAPRTLWWEVQRSALAMAAAGTAIGLGIALLVARGLQSLVYEVSVSDPVVLAASAAVALLGGFGAALLPAHRATNLEPTQVLRLE